MKKFFPLLISVFLVAACGQPSKTDSPIVNYDSLDKKIADLSQKQPADPAPVTGNAPYAYNQSGKTEPVTISSSNTVVSNGTLSENKVDHIWALESIDNISLNKKDFPMGTPYLNLSDAKQKIRGFTGCNGVSGTFSLENASINFGKLSNTTQNKCKANAIEFNILKNLSEKKIPVEFIQGKLVLRAGSGTIYTFHKLQ